MIECLTHDFHFAKGEVRVGLLNPYNRTTSVVTTNSVHILIPIIFHLTTLHTVYFNLCSVLQLLSRGFQVTIVYYIHYIVYSI